MKRSIDQGRGGTKVVDLLIQLLLVASTLFTYLLIIRRVEFSQIIPR